MSGVAEAATGLRPVTLVTGASSGIGRALALRAASEDEVLLIARREVELAALAGEIAAHGGRASWLALDLTEADAVARIMSALKERGLVCRRLVNNAGFGVIGLAHELSAEEQLASIRLNVDALAALSLAVLPGMVARGEGGLLNVASVASVLPGPGMAAYYAAKAFVLSFSEALAAELEGSGVTVSALCPGPVNTGFLARATRAASVSEATPFHVAADEVARQGWEGFAAGRGVIVPGWPNRLMLLAARVLPRRLLARTVRARQLGRLARPG